MFAAPRPTKTKLISPIHPTGARSKPQNPTNPTPPPKDHKDKTDKSDPCHRWEKETAKPQKRYHPTKCQHKAVPEARYDAIADETAERHRDREEHVSQPSVRSRDEVFADKQKRTPVE